MTAYKPKALVLMSGGLDSMLAAKLLLEQGVRVTALCFRSNFFNCQKAEASAKELNIELIKIDISEEELRLVKNPPSGYGKHLNPCIDCHGLMARKAGEVLKQNKFDIIASGEVLGQRPFSQTRTALKRVEKLAGAEILRPLSAKLLPATEYENKGHVNRKLLLDIRGRSRESQLAFAKKYKLRKYSTPAGGCLLTDEKFSKRLKEMLEYWPDCDVSDVELLKNGRVFWLKHSSGNPALVVVGRNHEENQKLHSLRKTGDIFIELEEAMGPTTMIRSKNLPSVAKAMAGKEVRSKNLNIEIIVPESLKISDLRLEDENNNVVLINIGCILTGYYSPKIRGRSAKFKIMI